MSYQLTGKIKVLGNIEQKSDTFKVRKFVVTIDGDSKYPQHIELQAANEKCDALNTFAVGNEVTVSFNLRGREWTGKDGEAKYFTALDAWKIEAGAGSSGKNNSTPAKATVPANQTPVTIVPETGDDLPF
ncbi:MAG: DUF3127 domain-containing protein [Nanoarchaeota archaeon]